MLLLLVQIDLGLSDDFLAGLQAHLDADTSALVVVVDQAYADYVSGLVAGAKGVILEEALTTEAIERLVTSESTKSSSSSR